MDPHAWGASRSIPRGATPDLHRSAAPVSMGTTHRPLNDDVSAKTHSATCRPSCHACQAGFLASNHRNTSRRLEPSSSQVSCSRRSARTTTKPALRTSVVMGSEMAEIHRDAEEGALGSIHRAGVVAGRQVYQQPARRPKPV